MWLAPFRLAGRLLTCAESADFIADGGYRQPALWLSGGWAQVQARGWAAPVIWQPRADDGSQRGGLRLAQDGPG